MSVDGGRVTNSQGDWLYFEDVPLDKATDETVATTEEQMIEGELKDRRLTLERTDEAKKETQRLVVSLLRGRLGGGRLGGGRLVAG